MKMHEQQSSSPTEIVTSNSADVARVEENLEDLLEELHADDSSKAVPTNGAAPLPSQETQDIGVLREDGCCFCLKCFASEHELESHFSGHAEGDLCTVCKQLVSAENLLQHCRQHLRDNSSLDSENDQLGLQAWEKNSSGGEFQCSDSPRSFQSKTGLSDHRATHSGQLKFFCDFCGKG